MRSHKWIRIACLCAHRYYRLILQISSKPPGIKYTPAAESKVMPSKPRKRLPRPTQYCQEQPGIYVKNVICIIPLATFIISYAWLSWYLATFISWFKSDFHNHWANYFNIMEIKTPRVLCLKVPKYELWNQVQCHGDRKPFLEQKNRVECHLPRWYLCKRNRIRYGVCWEQRCL